MDWQARNHYFISRDHFWSGSSYFPRNHFGSGSSNGSSFSSAIPVVILIAGVVIVLLAIFTCFFPGVCSESKKNAQRKNTNFGSSGGTSSPFSIISGGSNNGGFDGGSCGGSGNSGGCSAD